MQQDLQTGEHLDSEFRRSIWKALLPLAVGVIAAAYGLRSDNPTAFVLAAVALLSGSAELFWAFREPVLTITPLGITHRAGFLGRATEISKADVDFWKKERGMLVISRKGHKPVKIKLSVLRGKDQSRIADVLRVFGYPESK